MLKKYNEQTVNSGRPGTMATDRRNLPPVSVYISIQWPETALLFAKYHRAQGAWLEAQAPKGGGVAVGLNAFGIVSDAIPHEKNILFNRFILEHFDAAFVFRDRNAHEQRILELSRFAEGWFAPLK